MVVEQRAGTVGEGFLGELVQAFVRDFDGVLGFSVDVIEVTDLDRQPGGAGDDVAGLDGAAAESGISANSK